MVAEPTSDYPSHSQYAAITTVAEKLGIGTAETLRKWVGELYERSLGNYVGGTLNKSVSAGNLHN